MDKAKYKQYVELIRSRLSDYRFYHSVCVAEAAVQLAERFGADVEQAYVAGILHDVMKEEEPSVQRAYIEKAGEQMSDLEIRIGKVYHQMSGAAYVRLELHYGPGYSQCHSVSHHRAPGYEPAGADYLPGRFHLCRSAL